MIMRRFAAVAATACLALILSCGKYMSKTAYNNLDFLLERQIDSYFDINDRQKAWLDERIAAQLKWHREEALPGYIEIIRYVQDCIRNGFTEELHKAMGVRMREEMKRIAGHVADDAVEFLDTLSPAQIDYFRKEIAAYNKKTEDQIAARKKNPGGERLKSVLEMLGRYYGDFSSDQKKQIEAIIAAQPESLEDEARLKYLHESQQGFIALLDKKADKAVMKKYLIGWMTRDESFVPEYYREKMYQQMEINRQIFLAVDRTIVTKKQRDQGVAQLQDLIGTIETIMKKK
jgi:hypothetical protein